jgi:hypothetical protein
MARRNGLRLKSQLQQQRQQHHQQTDFRIERVFDAKKKKKKKNDDRVNGKKRVNCVDFDFYQWSTDDQSIDERDVPPDILLLGDICRTLSFLRLLGEMALDAPRCVSLFGGGTLHGASMLNDDLSTELMASTRNDSSLAWSNVNFSRCSANTHLYVGLTQCAAKGVIAVRHGDVHVDIKENGTVIVNQPRSQLVVGMELRDDDYLTRAKFQTNLPTVVAGLCAKGLELCVQPIEERTIEDVDAKRHRDIAKHDADRGHEALLWSVGRQVHDDLQLWRGEQNVVAVGLAVEIKHCTIGAGEVRVADRATGDVKGEKTVPKSMTSKAVTVTVSPVLNPVVVTLKFSTGSVKSTVKSASQSLTFSEHILSGSPNEVHWGEQVNVASGSDTVVADAGKRGKDERSSTTACTNPTKNKMFIVRGTFFFFFFFFFFAHHHLFEKLMRHRDMHMKMQ